MLTSSIFFSYNNLAMGGPFISFTCDVVFSSHGVIPSFPPLFSISSYNPSNLNRIEDVVMSLNGSSHILKEDLPIPSKVGLTK
jgi:hypothetical protein